MKIIHITNGNLMLTTAFLENPIGIYLMSLKSTLLVKIL